METGKFETQAPRTLSKKSTVSRPVPYTSADRRDGAIHLSSDATGTANKSLAAVDNRIFRDVCSGVGLSGWRRIWIGKSVATGEPGSRSRSHSIIDEALQFGRRLLL